MLENYSTQNAHSCIFILKTAQNRILDETGHSPDGGGWSAWWRVERRVAGGGGGLNDFNLRVIFFQQFVVGVEVGDEVF